MASLLFKYLLIIIDHPTSIINQSSISHQSIINQPNQIQSTPIQSIIIIFVCAYVYV